MPPKHIYLLKDPKGRREKTSCLQSLYPYVCVFDHCLTSNTAEIKAQNKCCENKSPRADTRDRAQDTDGVWDKKKNMERVWRSSVCLCVQALPEVAVCVVVLGGVQVLR